MGSSFCTCVIIERREMPSKLRRLTMSEDVTENNFLIPDLCHSSVRAAQLLTMSESATVDLVVINMLP